MMQKLLSVPLFFFPLFLFGQTVDSVALREVDSLLVVSRKLTGKSDYNKALEINAIAAKIALEKIGKLSQIYGTICYENGKVQYLKGDYEGSEKWCLESKSVREQALGKESLDYANSLNILGVLYVDMGKYQEAEQYYQQMLKLKAKLVGTKHADYLGGLINLGILYNAIGRYENAEELYMEAKSVYDNGLSKESTTYTKLLSNLGFLYSNQGRYDKSELTYLDAKANIEKMQGKENLSYALNLNNLAAVYDELGNYEKAESFFLESLAIRKRILGTEHPKYALSLNNLAGLYWNLGMYEKTKPLFLEAMAIREKVFGKDHPDYAESAENLANYYEKIADYKAAEPLFREALDIREKVFGKTHLLYAKTIQNLAILYRDMGDFEKAEQLFLETMAITEAAVGKDHPLMAECLDNLIRFYWAFHQYETVQPYILEASEVDKNLLASLCLFLSEQELESYIKKYESWLNRGFSFAQMEPDVTADCYDNALFYKGFLLNSASKVRNIATQDSANVEKFNLFKSYKRQLSAAYVNPNADQTKVAEWRENANSLEKELVRSVSGFDDATFQVNWQQVQKKLRADEVAIEFVHYKFINPYPTDSIFYAALLIQPEAKAPVFIWLCEEKQIKSLLDATTKSKLETINACYAPKTYTDNSLYALIWQPIERELNKSQDNQKKKTVYFSASGLLHRLNIGALSLPPSVERPPEQIILGDRYNLVELASTRSLVVPDADNRVNNTAILYGGIQYDIDTTTIASVQPELEFGTTLTRGLIDFSYTDSTLRGSRWQYLKWTEVEIKAAEAIFQDAGLQAETASGNTATEEAFKSIGVNHPSPRILHLATHGFFFPDPATTRNNVPLADKSEPIFKISDHPMIRSGLVLAGGNYAWQTGKPFRPNMEDGILTAYEISQMNLRNTELVVLSACETGLGDIQGNEGVYGLQRAFKIAGARYLILSLWQVPDYQTQALMTTFYSHWLLDKMTIPDAFRAAQKAMQEKYKDPFLWAGFVLVE